MNGIFLCSFINFFCGAYDTKGFSSTGPSFFKQIKLRTKCKTKFFGISFLGHLYSIYPWWISELPNRQQLYFGVPLNEKHECCKSIHCAWGKNYIKDFMYCNIFLKSNLMIFQLFKNLY